MLIVSYSQAKLLENARKVDVSKFEVVLSAVGKSRVELNSLTEVAGNHLLVVGASAEHSHQVVGGSVRLCDVGKHLLGTAVVLGKNLGEGSVVANGLAESSVSGVVVACLNVVSTESIVEFFETCSVAELLLSY